MFCDRFWFTPTQSLLQFLPLQVAPAPTPPAHSPCTCQNNRLKFPFPFQHCQLSIGEASNICWFSQNTVLLQNFFHFEKDSPSVTGRVTIKSQRQNFRLLNLFWHNMINICPIIWFWNKYARRFQFLQRFPNIFRPRHSRRVHAGSSQTQPWICLRRM